jgi:hypothetical protein
MSFTRISSLDQSIQKANTCLAEIADEFGAGDRRLAYRVTRIGRTRSGIGCLSRWPRISPRSFLSCFAECAMTAGAPAGCRSSSGGFV